MINKLEKFNDFMFILLLENNGNELPIVFSKRLRDILITIKDEHSIAKDLLEKESNKINSKFTLIDYDENEFDKFTYSTSIKTYDSINKKLFYDDDFHIKRAFDVLSDNGDQWLWNNSRSNPVRIGRFLNTLFPNTYTASGDKFNDIESFVELIKSKRTIVKKDFQIVEGKDIVKYYNEKTYSNSKGGSTLHQSCMKREFCTKFIEFFNVNKHKVRMLVSFDEKKRVTGRALLWNIDEIDGQEVNRVFMDRIYTIDTLDVDKFKDYAKENGFLFKRTQNSWSNETIIDSLDNQQVYTLVVKNIKPYKCYPYLDTIKFLNKEEKYLTNNNNYNKDYNYYELESTSGGYEWDGVNYAFEFYYDKLFTEDDLYFSEVQEIYIHPNNAIYSKYSDSYISEDYAYENYVRSDIEDDWLPKKFAIYVLSEDDWISEDNDDYTQSSYDNNIYLYNDTVPSDKWGVVPYDKRVYVIKNLNDFNDLEDFINFDFDNDKDFAPNNTIDNRWKDDNTYFTIKYNDEEYNFDNKLKNHKIVELLKKED